MPGCPRASGCRAVVVALVALALLADRCPAEEYSGTIDFNPDWLFVRGDAPLQPSDCAKAFPRDLGQLRCLGLTFVPGAVSAEACQQACCPVSSCETWQFCPSDKPCRTTAGCWVGAMSQCENTTDGWVSRARGDGPPASPYVAPGFDDSAWRKLEVPHDWSIEALPARATDTAAPVLTVRNGTWLFHEGDNTSWSAVGLDDATWTSTTVPGDWRDPPLNYEATAAFGWYRRHLDASALQVAAGNLALSLGTVASAHQTFLNGVQIGSNGDLGKDTSCEDFLEWQTFAVPAGLLKRSGNVVAVRVYSPGGPKSSPTSKPGGLYDSGAVDARVGAYDPGSSAGQKATGYSTGGVGWYRRHFDAPAGLVTGARLVIMFEGVYMNSDVWVNGRHVGGRPYGYSTFHYDLTGVVEPGSTGNVLAVRVNNNGRNSRWYSGSGIFRPVTVFVLPPVHAAVWSTRFLTPHVSAELGEVTVMTAVNNTLGTAASTSVSVCLSEHGGKVVLCNSTTVSIPAGALQNVTLTGVVPNPQLWDPATPNRYHAVLTVAAAGGSHNITEEIGFRSFSFSAERGLILNGKSIKLYGGCVHHANGPLGSRSIARADERRVELLKREGYNAIRTSHNPVSKAFVAACNRHGIILMEEAFDCFTKGKNPQDYHLHFADWWQRDIEALVLRDRNAPSILMWSIGNEIPIRTTPEGASYAHQLAEHVRGLDVGSGRVVTAAVPGVSDDDDAFISALDVAGYNYSPQRYVSDHQRKPDRIIVATESFPAESYAYWEGVWQNDWVIGDMIWTAIDYIGESGIGFNGQNTPELAACPGYCTQPYPYHVSYCGDLDLAGFKKPQSYYRNVLWNVSTLEMAVHAPVPVGQHEVIGKWGFPDERQSWTWETEGNLSVNVYSKAPAVRLSINDRIIGTAPPATAFTATFSVPYEHGRLQADALDATGRVIESKYLTTAGAPAGIVLAVDRAVINCSRGDLAYVTVAVLDSSGLLVPNGRVEVSFSLTGPGEIAAVGNGDPLDTSPAIATSRFTHRGRALVILRPGSTNTAPVPGQLALTATSPGIDSGTVNVQVVASQ